MLASLFLVENPASPVRPPALLLSINWHAVEEGISRFHPSSPQCRQERIPLAQFPGLGILRGWIQGHSEAQRGWRQEGTSRLQEPGQVDPSSEAVPYPVP